MEWGYLGKSAKKDRGCLVEWGYLGKYANKNL